jgi:predicted Zn-ribbon and HTH transcriptional regulator
MRKKSAEPRIPPERRETVRREIITLLREETLSAKEVSAGVGASEKEVYDHLSHIQKSREQRLRIIPAECRKCGFVFRKRERLRKPGRCPVCRGESIKDPFFSLVK